MAARRKTRRAKGDGSYWYDKARKLHRIRITINGEVHTVSDPDRSRAEARLRDLKVELAKQHCIRTRKTIIAMSSQGTARRPKIPPDTSRFPSHPLLTCQPARCILTVVQCPTIERG